MLSPSARPRSEEGKTAATMAAAVVRMKRAPDGLEHSGADHESAVGRERGGQREDAEEEVAEPVGEEEPMLLAPAPDGDEKDGDDEEVRGLHPEGFAEGQLQVGRYDRQRDGEDARVEGGQEDADGRDHEDAPSAPAELGRLLKLQQVRSPPGS